MARKKELTLVAAEKPQLKKKAKRDWSKAKAAKFLGVLAETCNVSEACRRSGVPMTVAYRRRKMDATFRAAWIEAVGLAYTVSFAVALSSRRFSAIGRIWADGRLIRDSSGAFTVNTSFRFHDGSEDQPIDPLIGSAEGIANTPAYRGLALAVFENLDLGEFGNRIPFLTFEVIADESAPTAGAILNDAADGSIDCGATDLVAGYAAYGRSIRSAIEPLVDCLGIELFDDGSALRSPTVDAALAIADTEFGNYPDGESHGRLQREQTPASALPSALRLSYYDPARDFQAGEARASAGFPGGTEEQLDLPAVLSADAAKSLAQKMLARRWAERDKLTLRLPPSRLALQPGSLLALPMTPANWVVEQCKVEAFVVVADLRPAWKPGVALTGDPGRIAANDSRALCEISLALFDVPQLFDQSSTQPTLVLASSSASPAWKSSGVEVTAGSQSSVVRTAARKTVLGRALTVLPGGEPYLIDVRASVEVLLDDPDQWVVSCDDDALVNGTNLAVLGSELIQFGEAVSIGPGQFRLSRLLRGRAGTEWAASAHSVGERFALLQADSMRMIELPDWITGSQVTASVLGSAGAEGTATIIATGESLRPPTPVRLEGSFNEAGELVLSWIRRSRRGWSWIDEIDAPLGESREAYRVTIAGSLGSVETTCGAPTLVMTASDLATVGPGQASVEVRQIGDWASSRPAQLTLTIA